MKWLQVKLPANKDNHELIADLLLAAGAISVTVSNPEEELLIEKELGTQPIWNRVILTAFFTIEYTLDKVKHELEYAMTPQELELITAEMVDDSVWQDSWKNTVRPTKINDKMWVCPSWCDLPEPGEPHIIVDPGMAFGTGSHPTTNLCLQWLTDNLQPDHTVVDYGCGSGILAIAAKSLGAEKVYAVDIDEDAIKSTIENAAINKVELTVGEPAVLTEVGYLQADIVIANILTEALLELRQVLLALVKPGAKLLLSGILYTQHEKILESFGAVLTDLVVSEQGEWVSIVGTKG